MAAVFMNMCLRGTFSPQTEEAMMTHKAEYTLPHEHTNTQAPRDSLSAFRDVGLLFTVGMLYG